MKVCIICNNQVTPYEFIGVTRIDCEICGPYSISQKVAMTVPQTLVVRHVYSGAIRELNERGVDVKILSFDSLLDSIVIPNGPLERIDRIVQYVYRHAETDDETVKLFPHDYPIGYAKNDKQLRFLIDRANELGYLESAHYGNESHCRLTPNGWKRVAELDKVQVRTNQAFVAMSFDPALRSVYVEGIKPAIEQTGYLPLRLDDSQYNERFDDRIIAEIRKSGLVIADVTGHNNGVYFEAGFALGLGIPVVWTCRSTDMAQVHPNTRQYNHIVWDDSSDLREKIIARIEATVPVKTGAYRT